MKDTMIKIGTVVAAVLGIYLYFQQRAYIGYFIAAFAIPYGVYGLFKPYKSAVEYAKKGCVMLYSRQLGSLILSLGILGVLFSMMYVHLTEVPWFLVGLLVYIVLFFVALYLLNKRYMNKPQ